MEQITGFPKNLAYNLKKLEGSILKQKITINSDKSEYKPNERIMFNFPLGRMLDSRSIVLTAKCKAATGNHFPRGGLNSLIENLQITANSRVIQSTQNYNFIWNILADLSGYFSLEQSTKRIYENFDPSISQDNLTGTAAPALAINTTVTSGNEELTFCVNNWLGFLSSSAPTWNTNDLGQIQMIITLAPASVQWLGSSSTAGTTATNGDYTVSEVVLSMDTVTVTDSLYLDLVKSQLETGGLNIGYNDYLISTGSKITKTANSTFTHVAQFSANSLDAVIGTFRHNKYNTANTLLLSDAVYSDTTASIKGSIRTLSQVLADPAANEGTHGGFNNSVYFQRCGGAIDGSSWYINSSPFTVNSRPIDIYNNTLQALDYGNLDIASGGLHCGVLSQGFYNKYYFADILSLENISGDNNNWISGIDGNSGITQIQYNFKFSAAGAEPDVLPVIIGKVSKRMNVKIGRNIDIEE